VCLFVGWFVVHCLLVCFLASWSVTWLVGWLASSLAGWFNLQSRGGQTVDGGQLFGTLMPLFGLYQNVFATSERSVLFVRQHFLYQPTAAKKPSPG